MLVLRPARSNLTAHNVPDDLTEPLTLAENGFAPYNPVSVAVHVPAILPVESTVKNNSENVSTPPS